MCSCSVLLSKIHHPFDRSSSSVLAAEFLRDFVRIEVIDGGPGIVKVAVCCTLANWRVVLMGVGDV